MHINFLYVLMCCCVSLSFANTIAIIIHILTLLFSSSSSPVSSPSSRNSLLFPPTLPMYFPVYLFIPSWLWKNYLLLLIYSFDAWPTLKDRRNACREICENPIVKTVSMILRDQNECDLYFLVIYLRHPFSTFHTQHIRHSSEHLLKHVIFKI